MSPCMELTTSPCSAPVGAFMVSGDKRRPLVLPLFSHSHQSFAMLTVLSVVLSLFGLIFVHLLLGLRRAARDVGSVGPRPRNNRLIHFRVAFSNLSGPFFLFHPLSALGFLTGQMVWKIPYLNAGNAWGHNEKHDGMCT